MMAGGLRQLVNGAPDNDWLEGDVRRGWVHLKVIAPAHEQEVGGGRGGTCTKGGVGWLGAWCRKQCPNMHSCKTLGRIRCESSS